MFKRSGNADSSNSWGNSIGSAIDINAANHAAKFTNLGILNSLSQFYIGSNTALSIENMDVDDFKIYPNPVNQSENLYFHNLKGDAKFSMFDMRGKQLFKTTINQQGRVKMPLLSKGIYLYNVETTNRIQNGKLIVKSK